MYSPIWGLFMITAPVMLWSTWQEKTILADTLCPTPHAMVHGVDCRSLRYIDLPKALNRYESIEQRCNSQLLSSSSSHDHYYCRDFHLQNTQASSENPNVFQINGPACADHTILYLYACLSKILVWGAIQEVVGKARQFQRKNLPQTIGKRDSRSFDC